MGRRKRVKIKLSQFYYQNRLTIRKKNRYICYYYAYPVYACKLYCVHTLVTSHQPPQHTIHLRAPKLFQLALLFSSYFLLSVTIHLPISPHAQQHSQTGHNVSYTLRADKHPDKYADNNIPCNGLWRKKQERRERKNGQDSGICSDDVICEISFIQHIMIENDVMHCMMNNVWQISRHDNNSDVLPPPNSFSRFAYRDISHSLFFSYHRACTSRTHSRSLHYNCNHSTTDVICPNLKRDKQCQFSTIWKKKGESTRIELGYK